VALNGAMPVTGEKIREALKSAPFTPFRLHLADQHKVDVFHPEFAWAMPNRRHALVVSPADGDTTETIDVALVVSLTPLPEPRGNAQAA
jgi:hypothetical protein